VHPVSAARPARCRFGVAHDDYQGGTPAEKIEAAHRRNLVIIQIETPKGVESAAAIAAIPNVDVLWVGHFDLTTSWASRDSSITPITRSACQGGRCGARQCKGTGFMASDERWGREYLERGFSMIAYGMDSQLYQRTLGRASPP